MIQMRKTVGVRYGQCLVAVMTNDLLAKAALLDGVTGTAGERKQDQDAENPSGQVLSLL